MKNRNRWLIGLMSVVVILASCARPVVVVEDIPGNTPRGAQIFITGEFNRWDPGDQRFILEMDEDSNYYITLPSGFGTLDFKLTRGDWTSVETDVCGYDIPNRKLYYGDTDTMYVSIKSWRDLEAEDCPKVTIVIDELPEDTPEDEPIAIVGDFNEWTPDSSSIVKKDTKTGKYIFTMPRIGGDKVAEFLVTRGDLFKAEADRFGNLLEKRRIRFGVDDTVFIDVAQWEDMQQTGEDRVVVIMEKIPEEYPDDKIYITGTFNGWYPRDPQYRFFRNDEGKYQVVIPRDEDEIQFKITRGDWSTEEVDILGYKKNNYYYEFGTEDTIFLKIHGWLDRSEIKHPTYTFLIESLPVGTPEDARIFLAASVNGWNPGSNRFRFRENDEGHYYLTIKDAWKSFEYKLTMGSWRKQEMDEKGHIIPNRIFEYNGQDTIHISVKNWMHIPAFEQKYVVIELDSVPAYTPDNHDVYITGTFNRWDPGDKAYILERAKNGKYYIRIPNWEDEIQFKFTLGSWDYEEQNAEGYNIENRMYRFGYVDTLRLRVENWKGIK